MRVAVVVGLAGTLALSGCASQDRPIDPDHPFANSRIEIVVPFREGGGSDTWSRAVGPHLARHLGDGARIRAVNVLGASGIQGGNEFALSRRHDGLSLFVTSGSNVLPYLLGERAVRYDFKDFAGVLGSPAGGVVYVSSGIGVPDVERLCAAPRLIYGGISPTGLDMVPLVAFELLGLDVLAILGYQGKGAARLALERGETSLDYQTTSAYLANVAPLVEEGSAVPMFSFGSLLDDGTVGRDPAFPELPSMAEAFETCKGQAPSGIEWDAYRAVLSAGFAAQKNLWVHRDAPAVRIDGLRKAAKSLVHDTEFLSLTAGITGGYDFYAGEEVDRRFSASVTLPPAARAWLLDFLRRKYDVAI